MDLTKRGTTNDNIENMDQNLIEKVEDKFVVFFSKESPMRICFESNNGKKFFFLLKTEKRGDLRKDAKMFQLAPVVNRIFGQSSLLQSRGIRMRSFYVAVLTENCGLIEWIPNTSTLKATCCEIDKSYTLKKCAQVCGKKVLFYKLLKYIK